MWFWNLDEQSEWTDLGKAIFGLPLDGRELGFTECFNQIHAKDRDRVRVAINDALTNPDSKGLYDLEYRVVWSDGSVHWITAKGKSFFDHNGNPISMTGTVQDVTNSKQVARQLREQEQLLRLSLHNARAGTWDWDLTSSTLDWSPENFELYGVEPQTEPLEYQDWLSLVHPDDLAASNSFVRQKAVRPVNSADWVWDWRLSVNW